MADPLHAPAARSTATPAGICAMTTEERAVLAWERIADELTLLNQSVEDFLDHTTPASRAAPVGGPAADVFQPARRVRDGAAEDGGA